MMKTTLETTRLESTAKEKLGLRFRECESERTPEKRRKSTELGQRYDIDAKPAQRSDSPPSHHRGRRHQKQFGQGTLAWKRLWYGCREAALQER